MICSQSASIDRDTNQVSFSDVVESFAVVKGDAPPPAKLKLIPLVFRVMAAWIKDENDPPEQKYEYHLTVVPPKAEETIVAKFEFVFKTIIQRINTNPLPLPQSCEPGILWLHSKLRRVGEQEWIAQQSFPIIVNQIEIEVELIKAEQSGTIA